MKRLCVGAGKNQCETIVVFGTTGDLNAILPINPTDTFEVVITLASVAAAAQMVVLTEYYGLPD